VSMDSIATCSYNGWVVGVPLGCLLAAPCGGWRTTPKGRDCLTLFVSFLGAEIVGQR
jgi:hypothetical protein